MRNPVSLYEQPACQVPPPLFLFFLSFLTFSLVRPHRRLSPAPTAIWSQAGARRCCQGWPLLQRPPPSGGPWPLQQSSTTAGLMGRGRLRSCCLFYPVFVSARAIPIADVFWQALLRSPWHVR